MKWFCNRHISGLLLLVFLLLVQKPKLSAEEGMWLLPLLQNNMQHLQELGLELNAEQVYSINNPSLKDAIVIFNESCTGEVVSTNGLLFTNYHCCLEQIQYHSTLQQNYFQDGFWAKNPGEELPNPNMTVHFLKSMKDVTHQILDDIPDTLNPEERSKIIRAAIDEIEEKAEENGLFQAKVKSFYAGNKYYLCVYQVYSDIRLVGVPPSSIGRFGYEHDNWEWPRHTGDFAIFRIYTAPDGSPAEYSEENIPLKTDNYLEISLQGANKGDVTMIMGYPGKTSRHKTSFDITETLNVTNKNRITIRAKRQEILDKAMNSDPEVAIKYASKYSSSSNYWKYSIGQTEGINTYNLFNKKKADELEFMQWALEDSVRNTEYGSILKNIEEIYNNRHQAAINFRVISEALFKACELIDFMSDFSYLNVLLQTRSNKSTEVDKEIQELSQKAKFFFMNYSLPTDRTVCKEMIKLYLQLVDNSRYPAAFLKLDSNKVERYVDKMYRKTLFSDREYVFKFLEKPNPKVLKNDYGFKIASSIYRKYIAEYSLLKKYYNELTFYENKYLKARMQQDSTKYLYPDANFTMRLSYGKINGYNPSDTIEYNEKTYLDEAIQKDRTGMHYQVNSKLKELHIEKDYGAYGENGTMPVCFISDNDITGGNSGSPVLNKAGKLIGIAFDSNWEALSSDIMYNSDLQRCISVDIRYVLFIIDKFAEANYILNELQICDN